MRMTVHMRLLNGSIEWSYQNEGNRTALTAECVSAGPEPSDVLTSFIERVYDAAIHSNRMARVPGGSCTHVIGFKDRRRTIHGRVHIRPYQQKNGKVCTVVAIVNHITSRQLH